jgi:hypothetical protein
MAGPKETPSAKSQTIRDQAMAILRETRAKIDPKLLSFMKDKLGKPQPQKSPEAPKGNVFSDDQIAALSQVKPTAMPPKVGVGLGASVYASTQKKSDASSAAGEPDASGMIPVDRQKVAKIVMEYMKNRQEKGSRH